MSERFNFYDIYGYVIPGFAFLGLLWLPVGIASGEVPDLGFSDALGGLLIAYILGHILSGVAKLAFPSGRHVARHDFRHPSDDLLDDNLYPKRANFNKKLWKKINDEYPDVNPSQTLDGVPPDLRGLVFRLCRDRLVAEDKGGYAEQFQGMYSMMRGISAASIIAAYYLLGWLFSSVCPWSPLFHHPTIGNLPMIVAYSGLAVAVADFWLTPQEDAPAAPAKSGEVRAAEPTPAPPAQPPERALLQWPDFFFWLLVLAATYAGFLLGQSHPLLALRRSVVVALIAGAVFLAGRCYRLFQHFARTFADTVYQNFLALPKKT